MPYSSLGYFCARDIFNKLIQHPLLWAFLATGGVYWLLTQVTPRDLKTDLSIPIPALDVRGWWQDHYVIVVIGVGLVMIAAAFHYYLIDIIRSVRLIVAQLVALLSETQTPAPADIAPPSQIGKPGDPTAIRDLSYAIAVLLGVLVAASTVPFALIRVWINDRTIKARRARTQRRRTRLDHRPDQHRRHRIGRGKNRQTNRTGWNNHRKHRRQYRGAAWCGLCAGTHFTRQRPRPYADYGNSLRLYPHQRALGHGHRRPWDPNTKAVQRDHAPIFRPR